MAQGDIQITIVGNLTNDPELRFTPSGAAVASFTVASTTRVLDKQTNEWKDGDTVFMRCSVWRQYAENVAESLQRGMRVIVIGPAASSGPTRPGRARSARSSSGGRRRRPRPALRHRQGHQGVTRRPGGGGFGGSAAAAPVGRPVGHARGRRPAGDAGSAAPSGAAASDEPPF